MSYESSALPEAREHYSYVTRSLIRLFDAGVLDRVEGIDVEPEYGYTTRIRYHDGSFRVTYGNDLGLNPGAAEDLAKDKGHTKFMLRTIGVQCPEGGEFLLPWWAETIGPSQTKKGNTKMRTTDEAYDYIEENLGFPVYVKPVSGSKGLGVHRVESQTELTGVILELDEARSRVAIIEEAIDMPDYRIVVLDGELISAYRRKPLSVTGNDRDSIRSLVVELQEKYEQEGRDTIINLEDPRIQTMLSKQGIALDSIPKSGNEITLASVSNLSAGGTSVDVTESTSKRWVDLSAYVARNFNLRLCGVDLACSDIHSDDSKYSVLEVNSAPGLDHYASSGAEQMTIVDQLYAKVLNAPPRAENY